MAVPALDLACRAAATAITIAALLAVPAAQEPASLGPNGHVIIVIVDGLRPDLISAEVSPALQRLVDEGASTLDARTVRPSRTLPSITSMLTGLPPQSHGILWNDYRPEQGIVERTTVFDVAHAAGMRTAFFSGKVKIRHAAPPHVIDEMEIRFLPDASIMVMATACLAETRPALMVVHLPNMDRAGHQYGWASEQQIQTLRGTDLAIESLIDAIESIPGLGPTRIILTADHGGTNDTHTLGLRRDVTVPWLMWGAGIEPATVEDISVTATAGTALRALGLEAPGTMDRGLPR